MALIGASIAEGLFPGQDPLGKEIKIAGQKSTVIGVIKKEGESLLGFSFDYQVVIPFNFARYILDQRSENSDPTIYVKAKPNVSNAEMMDELTGVMRGIRKLKPKTEPNFALNETSLLSKGFDVVFDIIGNCRLDHRRFLNFSRRFWHCQHHVCIGTRTHQFNRDTKSLGAKNVFILLQF